MKDVWQCGRDYEHTAQTETVLRLSHGGQGVWVGEGWGEGQRGGRVGETPWSATHREFGDARTLTPVSGVPHGPSIDLNRTRVLVRVRTTPCP